MQVPLLQDVFGPFMSKTGKNFFPTPSWIKFVVFVLATWQEKKPQGQHLNCALYTKQVLEFSPKIVSI